MRKSILGYSTLIFDCDGVVLNSNKVKTEAFYKVALPFGSSAATAMVEYHIANGGVSRYKKIDYFIEYIAPIYSHINSKEISKEELLKAYSTYVFDGLLNCEMAAGLEVLRCKTTNSRWLIVSGGDQSEIREVFEQRGISQFFDGGIFGSPDTKTLILDREVAAMNIKMPALFLGDSKYDYECAKAAGIDFIFVSSWSEVINWREFVEAHKLASISHIMDCIKE